MSAVIYVAIFAPPLVFWALLHRHIRGVWRERARKQLVFDRINAFRTRNPGFSAELRPPVGYVSPHERGQAVDF